MFHRIPIRLPLFINMFSFTMSNISLISPLSVFHGTKTSHISQLKKHTFSYQSTQPKQNCSMHDSEASQGVMGLRCNERWVLKKQDKEGLQKSTYTQWHNAQGRVSIYYRIQSGIRVKSYCRLNFLRVSIFNLERLDILQESTGQPCIKLLSIQFS